MLSNVLLELDRWTKYKGGIYDNRPTRAQTELVEHGTPGFFMEHADRVTLDRCGVRWGGNRPVYFSHAIEARDVTDLQTPGFEGTAAFPERQQAISIS